MRPIVEHTDIVVCPCANRSFEVKEIAVFYPGDLARCAPDEHGRMPYRPIPRSNEHAYFILVCTKCAKKFVPGAGTPEAEVVQTLAAKAAK